MQGTDVYETLSVHVCNLLEIMLKMSIAISVKYMPLVLNLLQSTEFLRKIKTKIVPCLKVREHKINQEKAG